MCEAPTVYCRVKYASMRQVSINATPWLNIGIAGSTMYSKRATVSAWNTLSRYFLQHRSRALGADQKTALGFNFKALALQHLQIYGQGYG